MQRWLRFGVGAVAIIAVLFGVFHAQKSSDTQATIHWVASVTKQASAGAGVQNQTTVAPLPSTIVPKVSSKPPQSSVASAANGSASASVHPTLAASKVVKAPPIPTPAASSEATKPPSTLVSSSSTVPTANEGSFTIVISEYQHVDVQKMIRLVPGENLMQYMAQNFRITTAYSGSFMLGIDGVNSQWTDVPVEKRQPIDWFLYVNGKEAPVGATEIVPVKGDVDVWDYHRWNMSSGQG